MRVNARRLVADLHTGLDDDRIPHDTADLAERLVLYGLRDMREQLLEVIDALGLRAADRGAILGIVDPDR